MVTGPLQQPNQPHIPATPTSEQSHPPSIEDFFAKNDIPACAKQLSTLIEQQKDGEAEQFVTVAHQKGHLTDINNELKATNPELANSTALQKLLSKSYLKELTGWTEGRAPSVSLSCNPQSELERGALIIALKKKLSQ